MFEYTINYNSLLESVKKCKISTLNQKLDNFKYLSTI